MFQMNSEYLKEIHKDAYKLFFQEHDLVVSLPHVFRWGHTIGRGDSPVSIKQKLPGKMYFGCNFRKEKGCSLNYISSFSQFKETFDKKIPSQVIPHIDNMTEYFDKILSLLGVDYGVSCSILSEYPRGHGTSFTSLTTTLFVITLFIKEGKISHQDMKNYDAFVGSNVYKDICLLTSYIKYMSSGKATRLPFVALYNDHAPLIQVGDIDFEAFSAIEDIEKNLWSLSSLYEKKYMNAKFVIPIAGIKKGKPMNKRKSKSKIPVDLDYGIIYSGISYDSQHVHKKCEKHYKVMNKMLSMSHSIIKTANAPACLHVDKKNLGNMYNMMSTSIYMRIVTHWQELIKHESDDQVCTDLIQSVIDSGLYHCLVEEENKGVMDMYHILNLCKTFVGEKIGLIPLSTANVGGCFFFVSAHKKSRSTIEKAVEKIRSKGAEGACLEYLSWRDGYEDSGLSIDQYISNKIYSEFIAPGSVFYISPGQKRKIANHHEVMKEGDTGIVLDAVYKKIYVGGKKLNHKDLCSQSTTVETLQVLFDRVGQYVHNSSFPISSYSKNKNEMLSKIIVPFKNLVEKHFDSNFDIECTGSIYDFQICLKQKPDIFHTIEPIQ